MATRKQTQAAKRNIRKAQRAARSKRTIAHMSKSTRRALGQQAARGRSRGGRAGVALEDRNRTQLYERARKHPRTLAHGQVGPDPSDPTRELTLA